MKKYLIFTLVAVACATASVVAGNQQAASAHDGCPLCSSCSGGCGK